MLRSVSVRYRRESRFVVVHAWRLTVQQLDYYYAYINRECHLTRVSHILSRLKEKLLYGLFTRYDDGVM
jgi:hypothetical protein